MAITKKGSVWIVSYCKRHPKTRKPVTLRRQAKSKAEANRLYNQLVIEVEAKINQSIIPNWKKLVEMYVKDLATRDISMKTVENYGLCLNAHTVKDWGDRLISEITSQDVRDLIKTRVGNRSQSHQKNLLKFIRGCFTYAVDSGLLDRNPTPRMKFRIGQKLTEVLNEQQIRVLLNQARIMNSEWFEIWATALFTGMRSGELYALTWDKVDLNKRLIKVDCSWNNKDGFKDTKSGDDRWVEIAPELVEILKELKLRNGAFSTFVLPRIDKWTKGEQARELRMFLEGLGLPPISFHSLRASWATLMLTKGIAPIQVMQMGGWKDLKTMQYYIRKAGVGISGITDSLSLVNLNQASVLNISR